MVYQDNWTLTFGFSQPISLPWVPEIIEVITGTYASFQLESLEKFLRRFWFCNANKYRSRTEQHSQKKPYC